MGAITAVLRDRETWARWGDWLAVAVAVALPWSTSAAIVLISLWYLTRVAVGDFAAVRRESAIPAGGLPLALCAVGALGMLWAAGVPWLERFEGFNAFYKFLAVPLLLAQFRRSPRAIWVLIGFTVSCVVLLAVS